MKALDLNIAEQKIYHTLRRNSRERSCRHAMNRKQIKQELKDDLEELIGLDIDKTQIRY